VTAGETLAVFVGGSGTGLGLGGYNGGGNSTIPDRVTSAVVAEEEPPMFAREDWRFQTV